MSTEPLNEASHEFERANLLQGKGFLPLPYELSGNFHSNQLVVFMHDTNRICRDWRFVSMDRMRYEIPIFDNMVYRRNCLSI